MTTWLHCPTLMTLERRWHGACPFLRACHVLSQRRGPGRDVNNGEPRQSRKKRSCIPTRDGSTGGGQQAPTVTDAAYNGQAERLWPCPSHRCSRELAERAPSCGPGGATIRRASRAISIRIWEVENPKHHLFLTLSAKGKLTKPQSLLSKPNSSH